LKNGIILASTKHYPWFPSVLFSITNMKYFIFCNFVKEQRAVWFPVLGVWGLGAGISLVLVRNS
jgi:hypothetical protein